MPEYEDYDYLLKSVIVGDSNVGKTQILNKFIDNSFTMDSKPTIGVQFGTKTIKMGNSIVKNQIWDTAGQQRFRALTCAYYRGSYGAIVVFDLTKSATFQHIQKWIKQIRQYSLPDVCILLVGNKKDIDIQSHQVNQQTIQNYASNNKLIYLSTSAFTGENINIAFQTLIAEMLRKINKKKETETRSLYDSKPVPKIGLDNDPNISTPEIIDQSHNNNNEIDKRSKPKIQNFQIEQTKRIKLNDKIKQPNGKKKACC